MAESELSKTASGQTGTSSTIVDLLEKSETGVLSKDIEVKKSEIPTRLRANSPLRIMHERKLSVEVESRFMKETIDHQKQAEANRRKIEQRKKFWSEQSEKFHPKPVDHDPKVKAVIVPSRFMVKYNEISSQKENPRASIEKKWEEYRKKMMSSGVSHPPRVPSSSGTAREVSKSASGKPKPPRIRPSSAATMEKRTEPGMKEDKLATLRVRDEQTKPMPSKKRKSIPPKPTESKEKSSSSAASHGRAHRPKHVRLVSDHPMDEKFHALGLSSPHASKLGSAMFDPELSPMVSHTTAMDRDAADTTASSESTATPGEKKSSMPPSVEDTPIERSKKFSASIYEKYDFLREHMADEAQERMALTARDEKKMKVMQDIDAMLSRQHHEKKPRTDIDITQMMQDHARRKMLRDSDLETRIKQRLSERSGKDK
eukprot:TRINITY_DN10828_c0_g1_i2.p1 TRINITY_DN10828_c0_g1~~TRINITY_DN10828_c0_g1_i2.p1  ORF type:complete len:429 (-),score=112.77 TRINITY_DN10828_c0_g1_i2:964-2250(-)